jgi:hypothetical protein
MSSPLGDTISLLSTTTPLTSGNTWTSSAVVLGMYNSLVVMVKTDVDSTLYVEWSGDNGINWDGSDSYPIIDAITKRVVVTTQQKTIRLRLVNGGSNQTYLRLFTYGVTTNNSSLVAILGSISIANLIAGLSGGSSQTTQLVPITEYNFSITSSSVATNCLNNSNPSIFGDLYANGNNANAQWGIYSPASNQDKYLYFLPSNTDLSEGIIQGRGHRLRGGETLTCRFIGSFGVCDSVNSTLLMGLMGTTSNTAYSTSLPLNIGGTFGWIQSPIKTNDNFGIVYGNGTRVVRTNWNLDKADGNSVLPSINFTDSAKPNYFQVELTSGGNLRFSVMSPSTNTFIPVHQVSSLNFGILNLVPEMCFTIYGLQGSGRTTGTDQVSLISAVILSDLPFVIPTSNCAQISYDIAVSGAVITPIALRNSPTYGGVYSQSPVNLKSVSITTSGLSPVTVSFIADCIVTGGTWLAPTSGLAFKVPIQNNITGTITVPAPANTIYQYELAANDSITIEYNSLTPFLYGYRPLAIRVNSKSTSDVRVCLNLC